MATSGIAVAEATDAANAGKELEQSIGHECPFHCPNAANICDDVADGQQPRHEPQRHLRQASAASNQDKEG